MNAQEIIALVSQLGFPIVLTGGLMYWLGRYAWPKYNETLDKIVERFADEMKQEREFHRASLATTEVRLCSDIADVKSTICAKTSEIKEVIRDHRP